jgi:16S rRNA (guanine527-N7)-methyltransferase
VTGSALRQRIEERAALARLTVPLEAFALFEKYYALLERWNPTVNLTSLPLTDYPAGTVDRLFIEPLIAASLVVGAEKRWFDVGSGGGSPAVPMKILRPALALDMVESNQRKAAFLREVVRAIPLSVASVRSERFEALSSESSGTADLVTIRAVRVDEGLFGLIETALRPGGELLLFATGSVEGSQILIKTDEVELYPSRGRLARYVRR